MLLQRIGLSWAILGALVSGPEMTPAQSPAVASSPAPDPPLDYVILATGGELLEGTYADAHTPFLTHTLRPLGCRCVGVLIVDDQPKAIQEALGFATNRAPLVLVTGGLGPTPNDITRETLSAFTGIGLWEDPQVLASLSQRFHQADDQLRPNLRRQALVPRQGGYLKNGTGTAVGLVFDRGGPVLVALPGPPRELQPMVQNELIPFLRLRFGVHALGLTLTVRFVGIGQSQIDQTIQDHLQLDSDLVITSLFEGGRVDFTFALPGHTDADQVRLQRLEEGIRRHLGDFIYATDGASLEQVVLEVLRQRGDQVALAEIGSAGRLAAALQAGAEGPSLLAGAFVAPSLAALARLLQQPPPAASAVVEPTIRSLAAAAAGQTQCALVIAVGPVESPADSSPQVTVVFHFSDGEPVSAPIALWGEGELRQANLTTAILDRLWRRIR